MARLLLLGLLVKRCPNILVLVVVVVSSGSGLVGCSAGDMPPPPPTDDLPPLPPDETFVALGGACSSSSECASGLQCRAGQCLAPYAYGPAPAALVADLDGRAQGSDPDYLTEFGGYVYFGARSVESGEELWRADAAGEVELVADLWPGPGSGSPYSFKVSGSRLFFYARDPVFGTQLWSTDGTQVVRITDFLDTRFFASAALDGALIFHVTRSDGSPELYSSDGTPGGAQFLGSVVMTWASVQFGSSLIFAGSANNGRELWITNGTAVGTREIVDLDPSGSSSPEALTPFGGYVLFFAETSAQGRELWRTDGTSAGTELVMDIRAGSQDSVGANSRVMVPTPTGVLFAADDGVVGREPWFSDGTAAGTHLVADLSSSGSSLGTNPDVLSRIGAAQLDGYAYFYSGGDTPGLWRTNGTEVGTELVTSGAYASDIRTVGASVWFATSDPNPDVRRCTVYRTDGQSVTEIETYTELQFAYLCARDFRAVGSRVFYSAYSDSTGVELWSTDGTPGAATATKLFSGNRGGQVLAYAQTDTAVYFVQDFAPQSLYRLNLLDDSVEPISLDADLEQPVHLATLPNGTLVFSADHPDFGLELWSYSGSGVPQLISDINPGTGDSISRRNTELVALGGNVYFWADDGANGWEYWRTDGTAAGTQIVTDTLDSEEYLSELTKIGNDAVVYSVTNDAGEDSSSTTWVIRPDGSRQELFTAAGETSETGSAGPGAFWIFEEANEFSLWFAPAGLLSASPVMTGEVLWGLTGATDWVYVLGVGADGGTELWRSDGSQGGTWAIGEVDEWDEGATAGNHLIFWGVNGGEESILMSTDGMGSIQPVATDTYSSAAVFAGDFQSAAGLVVFRGYNQDSGYEMWVSDGTATGTGPLIEQAEGPENGIYRRFQTIEVGDEMFFSGCDRNVGCELRRLEIPWLIAP